VSAPADSTVNLPDGAALADLSRFVRRAIRLDPGGSIRLSGHGEVLAAYCSALSGGGGPTVLGLRTMVLATSAQIDVTLELEALRDRLARLTSHEGSAVTLDLTPGSGVGSAWAGLLPPRTGWSLEGLLEPATLTKVAAAGIAEVAAGTPSGAGSAAVAQLRAKVWGRDLAENSHLPAGAAFAAEAFGFMGDEAVSVHRCGPWWRLSLLRGHILARRTSALS
jgi:hypothetical protein